MVAAKTSKASKKGESKKKAGGKKKGGNGRTSGWVEFMKDKSSTLQEGLGRSERMKKLAALWKALSEKEQQVYNDKATQKNDSDTGKSKKGKKDGGAGASSSGGDGGKTENETEETSESE